MRSRLALLLVSASSSIALPAYADETVDANRALAADLFDAGVKAMHAGKCDGEGAVDVPLCTTARDDFRRAVAVYPAGLGALRNLAYVERGLRLVASASRDFRELARRAPLDPDPKRRPWAEFARREETALEPRVPHVTLTIDRDAPADLTVTVDGTAVPRAAWGARLDVDPGMHTVHAEAKDHAPFDASFTLAESEARAVAIPFVAKSDAPSTASTGGSDTSHARVAPIAMIGLGGATIAAGLVLGLVAIQKHSTACGDSVYCEPTGLDSGRSVARASTLVTTAGAAVLGGGLVWFFLASHGETEKGAPASASARLVPYGSPDGAGLRAEGAF